MREVSIYLLGRLDLAKGRRPLPKFPTRKARSLFAFLVLHHGRPFQREFLAEMFWGDRGETAARKCLRTEIWRIRSILGTAEDGRDLLEVQHDSLAFTADPDTWVDVLEFEHRLLEAKEHRGDRRVSLLREAASLYRGDLLEGVYDDWCTNPRERFQTQFLFVLDQLMEHHMAQADWDAAIRYGSYILQQDVLIEHVHRALMWCYWQSGNQTAALRRYVHCRESLARELNVEPMPETTALYQAIRMRVAPPPRWTPGPHPSLDEASQRSEAELLNEVQSYLGKADGRRPRSQPRGGDGLSVSAAAPARPRPSTLYRR